VLGIQWLLYARLFDPDQPARWLRLEVAFQDVVVGAALAYLLLELRSRPSGLAWGAPPVAAVLASALGLQLVLVRFMRILRRG